MADAPEPMALQWAARNPWFGTDSEMTYYAYEVHDQLIEQEGVDPNSAEYYEQIGFRVEQRFPERYAPLATVCACLHFTLYMQAALSNSHPTLITVTGWHS